MAEQPRDMDLDSLELPAQSARAGDPLQLPLLVRLTLPCPHQSAEEISSNEAVMCLILGMEDMMLQVNNSKMRGRVYCCVYIGCVALETSQAAPFSHLSTLVHHLYGKSTGAWRRFQIYAPGSPWHNCLLDHARRCQGGPGFINTLPSEAMRPWQCSSAKKLNQAAME